MPRFFVALAHTDNISRWENREATEKSRVTNINLFPGRLRENLLFSLSFDSTIHYNTLGLDLDPLGAVKGLLPHTSGPKRVFADCGAFQFRASAEPKLDGELLTAKLAWDHYQENHLSHAYPWQEILLCSPDHIVAATMTHEEAEVRFAYIKQHAGPFLELCKAEPRVTAVGVIHGRNNKERAEQYLMFKSLGYRYVALGGMVPYASNTSAALNIIAGIRDLSDAWVEEGSILDMCRRDGIKLHIFGLNSPDWVRWWHRLEIDSFDGSKLSTEGAGNGWYYIPKDGKGHGRQFPTSPTSASDLFHRFPVKKMQSQRWNWCPAPEIGHSLWDIKYRENSAQVGRKKVLVSGTNIMINGVQTYCSCPACQYLRSSRCTSQRCWMTKEFGNCHHSSDPRMMGSTEHNMGRVAHNAFVFSWLIEQIERLNEVANSTPIRSYNAWMENWNSISTRSTYVLVQCSKLKSIPVDTSLVWKNDTKLEAWNEAMMQKQERIIASELYTGRTFVNQLQHLSRLTKVYIISAGAGLISMNQSIPAYDATFQSPHGPSVTEWHKLAYGGLSNLNLGENDRVVSFASPSYHRAIMADPHFASMCSKFVVANTSPISKVEGVKSLPVHPRTAEYLKIASIDLNSALLKLFLEGGEGKFHEIFRECEALPSLKDKEKMTDEELLEVVRNLAPIRKIDDVIHHIRHVLGRKAAEKRIRDCVRQVRRSK